MALLLLNQDIQTRRFDVPKGERLVLNMACFDAFPNAELDIHLQENCSLEAYFADFSKGRGNLQVRVYLEGAKAQAVWRGAVVSSGDSMKTLDVSMFHEVPQTEALMANYGIASDQAHLVFTGVSHIKEKSESTLTRQEAKIIIFDPRCVAKANPILRIDNNNVAASHAATVGKLDDSHLFYLMARGLSKEEARRLIVMGYLKPIVHYFEDKAIAQRIDDAIEGGI